MANRADGLDPYVTGLPREWVERLANSDENTDVLLQTTRLHHDSVVAAAVQESAPGQGPQPVVMGTTMGLSFDNATDAAYRVMKVDSSIVEAGNLAGIEPFSGFHVHWTKSVDTDASSGTVRWRLSYTQTNGSDEDVALATPTVVEWDDVYDDAGTTTRIVYNTGNQDGAGLIARNYLGLQIEYVAAQTTVVAPVLVALDFVWLGWLNV
jgi:hypothetical protein